MNGRRDTPQRRAVRRDHDARTNRIASFAQLQPGHLHGRAYIRQRPPSGQDDSPLYSILRPPPVSDPLIPLGLSFVLPAPSSTLRPVYPLAFGSAPFTSNGPHPDALLATRTVSSRLRHLPRDQFILSVFYSFAPIIADVPMTGPVRDHCKS